MQANCSTAATSCSQDPKRQQSILWHRTSGCNSALTLSRWSECSRKPVPAPSPACAICVLSAFQLQSQNNECGGMVH